MARISRGLAVVAAVVSIGCSKDGTPSEQPEPAPAPSAARPRPVGPAILVGVVHEAGDQVCRTSGASEWINRHHQVGFVRVLADGDALAQLGSQLGKPIVARGRVAERVPAFTDRPPADMVDCPPAQMRMDWVPSPEGFRMRRGGGPGIPAFEVDRVDPFEGLRAEVSGDELRFELTNTLGVALAAPVEIVVHYEGCYGKPGATERSVVGDAGLAPGDKLSGVVPTITEADRVPGNPKGTREHRAYSIEVRASGDDVFFDFDQRLAELGAAVRCPE